MLISKLINPIEQFGRLGKIHSVFDGSFLIQIKNQLIHIGCYQQYVASFGTYIERSLYGALLPYLKVGNVVTVTDETFSVYSRLGVKTIALDFTELDLEVHPVPMDDQLIEDLHQLITEQTQNMRVGLQLDNTFSRIQEDLMTANLSEQAWQRVVTYLVGRGKGLTPSGDDFLVGYLLVMKLFNTQRAQALSQALTQTPLSTTDVSKAYLLSCVKGYVSSPLHELYQAVQREAVTSKNINRVMRIGHTSGRDMTFGIKVGVDYIFNSLK